MFENWAHSQEAFNFQDHVPILLNIPTSIACQLLTLILYKNIWFSWPLFDFFLFVYLRSLYHCNKRPFSRAHKKLASKFAWQDVCTVGLFMFSPFKIILLKWHKNEATFNIGMRDAITQLLETFKLITNFIEAHDFQLVFELF